MNTINMEGIKQYKTGTTTVGLRGKDFVVLASDRRVTSGYTIGGENFPKVNKINDYIGITVAGSVSAVQDLTKYMRMHVENYEIEREHKINIKAFANILSLAAKHNLFASGGALIGAFIVGGIDEKPSLYSVSPDGAILDLPYTADGSGEAFAISLLESEYKDNISQEEAIKLAIKAIEGAKKRDIGSGGKLPVVVVINNKGYNELSETELRKYVV
jgi:proteasome beta subunit